MPTPRRRRADAEGEEPKTISVPLMVDPCLLSVVCSSNENSWAARWIHMCCTLTRQDKKREPAEIVSEWDREQMGSPISELSFVNPFLEESLRRTDLSLERHFRSVEKFGGSGEDMLEWFIT